MKPLDELQEEVNRKYYSEKGERIYCDFSTYVSRCSKIAHANAIDFARFMELEGMDRAVVCETGVGGGKFALDFLEKLEELKGLEGVEYFLCDFSQKMLSDAESKLERFGDTVKKMKIDFGGEFSLPNADYIRMNELLTDIPAKVFVRDEKEVKEVFYEFSDAEISKEYREVKKDGRVETFLSKLPDGYEIPFNFNSADAVFSMCNSLGENGYLDIFDYGFFSPESIVSMPMQMWNSSVVREYGGQLTVDLNFPYIMAMGRAAGCEPEIESQLEYVESSFGKKIHPVEIAGEMLYLDEEEICEREGELEREGYSKEYFRDEILEESNFYHLRFRKAKEGRGYVRSG